MRKPILLSTCILFFSAFVLNISNLQAQATWHPYQTIGQVQIDYSDPVNCSFSEGTTQAEYIFLKISNLSNNALQVSFRVDTYEVGSGCVTCNNNEYQYSFNIPANGTINADCNFLTTGKDKLAIFKKFISKPNKRVFEKFEITNIVIQ